MTNYDFNPESIHAQDWDSRECMASIMIDECLNDYFTPRQVLNLLRQIWSSLPTPYKTKDLDELEIAIDNFEKYNPNFQLQASKLTDVAEIIHKFSIPLKLRKDDHYPIVYMEMDKWLVALEWLVKIEWNRNFKIKLPKPYIDAHKPGGIILSKFFRLCERCHSYQESVQVNIPFKNARRWLRIILMELIAEDIVSVYYPKPLKICNNNIKEALLYKHTQRLSEFKNYNNPFKDTPWRARSILIDAAIELSEKSERFHVEYWKPFLEAYSDYIRSCKKFCQTYFYKDGKVYQRNGRGKGVKLIGTLSDFKHLCTAKPY